MSNVETIIGPLPAEKTELLAKRATACGAEQPISIYEVHLPSWMRVPEEGNRSLTYFEIAPKLAGHVTALNFTHVQIHAPGFTDAAGMRLLIEHLLKQGLGVILDIDQPLELKTPALEAIPFDGYYFDGETHLFDSNYKWDTGWAEDTVAYFATDPLYRKFRQGQFRHRDGYAFDADYILPLSRRLVTRPRQSLFTVMPGDAWQKFANLRLLFAYTFLLPGKKLLFMGDEFGQQNPWQPETSLDWHLLDGTGSHGKLMGWVAALNRFYCEEPVLHENDSDVSGFKWIDTSDAASSVISFLRQSPATGDILLAVLNFTPVPRQNYCIGVPRPGLWTEILNSDTVEYGGSGQGNSGGMEAVPVKRNLQSHSLSLTLPPLGAVVMKAGHNV